MELQNLPAVSLFTLLFFSLLYIIFIKDTSINSKLSPPWPKSQHHPTRSNEMTSFYRDDLEEALAGASTKSKTLIIATVNEAYVQGDKPMLDLFLDGFWIGEDTRLLVDHLFIVAVDNTSFNRCRFLRLQCYKLETPGADFAGEKLYMSADLIKMMWRRTHFLGDVLKRGYDFIFTDVDVLWLRNPLWNRSLKGTTDLQMSTDKFNGNARSEANLINTGFHMIRSSIRTIKLLDTLFARKDISDGMNEQGVLQMLIREGILRKFGLKAKFLDTVYFSGFCQDSGNIRVVKTVHANCCRSIRAKLADLRDVIHDWKRYKSFSANETRVSSFRWSRHGACRRSWQ